MIIHLEKEQLKQARRDLLRDDVYIIFVDALRQYHQEGYTTLAPAELYLSAKYFVGDVLQLPDIIEGIADEMDDIMDEADNKDEAMLIMMVATGVFCAVGKKYKGGDADAVIRIIYDRWVDHPLFLPMLDICAKKEQEKWLKGKKTNLLTCELESMKTDGTTEAEASDFLHPFLQQVCEYSDDTIEKVLNPLRDLNEQYSRKFDKEVMAMPVRAAMDAGVIRRPSFVEYEAVAVLADISKTSFESYTNPVLKPYDDAAFWDMVNTFRHIV